MEKDPMDTLQAVYFGQRHADFAHNDFAILQRIARLSKKHQKQCENDCNGAGMVKGQMFYTGNIDNYAQRQYGYGVKSGILEDGEITVFQAEIGKIEKKINQLIHGTKFTVEYQHDPRGWTVKVSYEKDFINW